MYKLRPEQQKAIKDTLKYWQNHHSGTESKFLWNAKPRFGKTLATYDLMQKIQAQRVLIVTNRPAISDSWAHDFFQYIAPNSDYIFASSKSDTVNVDNPKNHIFSRTELTCDSKLLSRPLIFFISLQDLKGKGSNSDNFKTKNRWIFDVSKPWDLVIIDESHEGIKTIKSTHAFSKISTNFTLYLSGTPFRALADEDFSSNQIFNWTYIDEQKSYTDRPRLNFQIYPYTINLDERIELITQTFRSHPDFLHTFWLASTIEECQKIRTKLLTHPFFRNYQILLVAGRASYSQNSRKNLNRIREAIGDNPHISKTITISCGQLTTGITIPEWSAIFMLYSTNDLSKLSSAQYLQAAFRVQNPWHTKQYDKTESYIFDFLPDRSLIALQDYAINLCTTNQLKNNLTHEAKMLAVKKLLRYLTIRQIDKTGNSQPLSTQDLVELPRQFIANEIVESGFISTEKLFNSQAFYNISNTAVDIINKLQIVHKNRLAKHSKPPVLNPTIQTLAPDYSRRQKNPTKAYHEKLRGLTRTIPLLLHIDKSCNDIDHLADNIPDELFQSVTNITKDDFRLLLCEKIFDQVNCNLAIQEFRKREYNFAEYFRNNFETNIFSYISSQYDNQIFTSIHTVNTMLDKLEELNPDLFKNPNIKFFDPSAKSGLFLAAILSRVYHNLRPNFTNDHDCLYHIITKQIYAWSPNEFTHRTVINTVLSFVYSGVVNFSKVETEELLSKFVEYNPAKFSRAFDYNEINLKLKESWSNMKFNVIISNPPYQLGRRQIYADFYRLAIELNPDLICMVFPQGWQKPRNHNGLGQLNNTTYKRDPHIVSIDNYDDKDAERIFPNIATGSINIILRDANYNNGGKINKLICGQDVGEKMILPIHDSETSKPIELVPLIEQFKFEPKIDSLGTSRKPYGFYADPLRNPGKYNLTLSNQPIGADDVRLFGLLDDSTRGYKYLPKSQIPKISPNLERYKLFVPKAWGNMSKKIGLGGSFSNICVASPGDICTETFIEFGPFASQDETIKAAKYFMTKFFRALLCLAKTSQNTPKDKYRYVPLPDFNAEIWQLKISELDAELFKKYKIPITAQDFIMHNLQPRNESNIELL